MRFQGAVIREQNVTFAIAVVRQHVIDSQSGANKAVRSFGYAFNGLPTVLMAQDGRGRPTWYGRPDLTRFLSRVPVSAIPWREYTLN